jgi:hypothetical protein
MFNANLNISDSAYTNGLTFDLTNEEISNKNLVELIDELIQKVDKTKNDLPGGIFKVGFK